MKKEILQKFIKEFIPTSKTFRKNGKSDIFYVSDTIASIFNKYQGKKEPFEIEELFKIFDELDYRTFRDFNSGRTSRKGIIWGGNVNVDTLIIGKIRLASRKLPEKTSEKKKIEVQELLERLKSFFDLNIS